MVAARASTAREQASRRREPVRVAAIAQATRKRDAIVAANRAAGMRAWQAECQARRTATARRLAASAARENIRRHPFAIAGYASRIGREQVVHGMRHVTLQGAFDQALARGDWYLLLNHAAEGASLASMANRTMHAEVDAYGLWIEAHLSDDRRGAELFEMLESGVVRGLSLGDCDREGVRVSNSQGEPVTICRRDVWEISLVTPPHSPAAEDTWVRPYREAHLARREFQAIARPA